MPNYAYKCGACDHEFEALLVSVAEGAAIERKACPECKRRKVRRVIGSPAVHMRYSQMHPRHMRGQRGRPTKRGPK
jgi:putative FmdB family regulatory protein